MSRKNWTQRHMIIMMKMMIVLLCTCSFKAVNKAIEFENIQYKHIKDTIYENLKSLYIYYTIELAKTFL